MAAGGKIHYTPNSVNFATARAADNSCTTRASSAKEQDDDDDDDTLVWKLLPRPATSALCTPLPFHAYDEELLLSYVGCFPTFQGVPACVQLALSECDQTATAATELQQIVEQQVASGLQYSDLDDAREPPKFDPFEALRRCMAKERGFSVTFAQYVGEVELQEHHLQHVRQAPSISCNPHVMAW
jgi:hypothetical protein